MSAKKKGSFYYMVQDLKKLEPFSKKLKYLHFYQLARKNGVVDFRLNRIASEYTADYYADTGIPRRKKNGIIDGEYLLTK